MVPRAFMVKILSRFVLLGIMASVLLSGPGCSTAEKNAKNAALENQEQKVLPNSLGWQIDFKRRTLPNGLNVVTILDSHSPVISYQTWVRAGTIDEEFGYSGVAHMFEHYMFKKSKKFGPKAFFTNLELFGANVNAIGGRDYTMFFETFVPSLLDRTIELEVDRLQNFDIDDLSLLTEKQISFEERRLRVDESQEGSMDEKLWDTIFEVHPYKNPILGHIEDLQRIGVDQMSSYFSKFFRPTNIWVVVAGPISHNEVFEKIKNAYSNLPTSPAPVRVFPEEPNQQQMRAKALGWGDPSYLTIGYPITPARDPETYALDLLSQILFDDRDGILHQLMFIKNPIAWELDGFSYTPTYPGVFSARARLRKGVSITEFQKRWREGMRYYQENLVSSVKLEQIKSQLLLQILEGTRSSYGKANLLGTVAMILGDPIYYTEDIEGYRNVTPEKIRSAAKKYLIEKHENWVFGGKVGI